jgi:hypothetical protein
VGTKVSVIQHLRTCGDDGPGRPIETECFFVAEYRLALRPKNAVGVVRYLLDRPSSEQGLASAVNLAGAAFDHEFTQTPLA